MQPRSAIFADLSLAFLLDVDSYYTLQNRPTTNAAMFASR